MKKNKKKDDKEMAVNSEVKESVEAKIDKQPGSKQEIDYKSKFMRVAADFENFRKRTEKEKSEWGYISQADIILKFLPFADDLGRAIDSHEKLDIEKKQKEDWLAGFKIIQKNLKKVFDDLDVVQIDCTKQFDPKVHEALVSVESKDKKSGQIVDVVNNGYLFKGKVLRHAKVVVAK